MSIQPLFDYESLDVETRSFVIGKTAEIVGSIRRSCEDIVAIGEALIEVKQRLGHGRFGAWLEAEFQWSASTAQKLMAVAGSFKSFAENGLGKSVTVTDLDVATRALYSLAAPSVPEEALAEAIERASNGEHIGTEEAEEIIDRHRPPEKKKKKKKNKNKRSTNGHASTATQPAPETSRAERHREHFLKCLDNIDDLTRSVAAEIAHGGFGGFPAVLDTLSARDRLRVRGTVEIMIERLQDWLSHFPEFPDEQDG